MTIEIRQKYKAKAKDSFKTKKNLFLFHSVINGKSGITKHDFEDFDISEDLIKCYTSEYWQQEIDYQINGLKISEIEKAINVIQENYADIIKELETIYVDTFSRIFSEADFEKLLMKRECHYCKITVDEIEKLGAEKLLYKKTLRGWNLEIDRLNSNYEYSPTNCVMSCYWCNNAKTDEFTEEEFFKIGTEIKKVWEDRQKMISDRETNTIYFSELLKTDSRFIGASNQIFSTLDDFGVKYNFLPDTNDIWARDYMPIQINDKKFIEYRYDPDYLQGIRKGSRNLKTYPDIVCDSIKLSTKKSDLIMDGGNFVKSSNWVILTEKIIKENRFFYSKADLIKKLHDTFQADVILIPQDKLDEYGHSDGMIRFINNDTVLINHYYKSDSVIQYRLKQAGLKTEFIDYKVKNKDKRNWAYLNFLQTKDLILLPKFEINEDREAFEQIENYYPDYKGKIAQVEMNEIVKFGGALNCITWTTKE